jgi:hypothetical protein
LMTKMFGLGSPSNTEQNVAGDAFLVHHPTPVQMLKRRSGYACCRLLTSD